MTTAVYCCTCTMAASNNEWMLLRHSILASRCLLSLPSIARTSSSDIPEKLGGGIGGGTPVRHQYKQLVNIYIKCLFSHTVCTVEEQFSNSPIYTNYTNATAQTTKMNIHAWIFSHFPKLTLPLIKLKVRSYYTTVALRCWYIDYFLPQVTAALPHFKLKWI